MPSSFVNYQVKSNDQSTVVAAVSQLSLGRGYVSPEKNGWVTLYDETSEGQDAYEIGRLGSELSARLGTVVFAFLVSDSSLFVYYLFDNGDLLDEYNSAPGPVNADADPDQKFRFNGRPEILLLHCPPGTSRGDLEVALMPSSTLIEGGFASAVNAEERLHPLTEMLGIDGTRATMGFGDFDRGGASMPQARDFVKIDNKRNRRGAARIRRVPPRMPPR